MTTKDITDRLTAIEALLVLAKFAKSLLDAAKSIELEGPLELAETWKDLFKGELARLIRELRENGGELHGLSKQATVLSEVDLVKRIAAVNGLLSLRIDILETIAENDVALDAMIYIAWKSYDDACDDVLKLTEQIGEQYAQRRGVSREIVMTLWTVLTQAMLPIEAVNETDLPTAPIAG